MPSGRNIKPPPNFSFVTAEFEGKEVSWLKKHSGAARSHAAYWGASIRHKRLGKNQITGQQGNTITSVSETEGDSNTRHDTQRAFHKSTAPIVRRLSAKPKCANVVTSYFESPRYLQTDDLQHLPLPSETKATRSPFAAGVTTFEFFGEGFVKQFLMFDHEDYPIVFSGCLLLSYAHHMALTGRGTKTVLLELKSQVIRRISAKMKFSDSLLSPRCLTAILALGAPIVCLMSQDLPKGLSVWDYINASMRHDYLCCQESADAAYTALDERIVHRQAMHKLFLMSFAGIQDAVSLALLQYVSNSINISMAIEAANYLNTPMGDVETLFPPTNRCENCSIPTQWASPLTCQWFDQTSTKHTETQMLELAGLMHRWLGTFLDADSHLTVPTKPLLNVRASLRFRIECFEPVAANSHTEEDAMTECCRWASLILLAVERQSSPIHVVAKQVRIRKSPSR